MSQAIPQIDVGARPQEVVGLIARQGLWMSIVGIGVGGIALIPVLAAIRNVVTGFGVGEVDPVTITVAVVTLFLVTLVATVVPALRAATVDPVKVLKVE